MSDGPFLALLRGINVGGKNIIAKEDLRECFESIGCSAVRTYIQSGNILFRSNLTAVRALTEEVERALTKRFDYEAQAVILSRRKYGEALAAAPRGWGQDETQKHNALFTLKGTTPARILSEYPVERSGIEVTTAGKGVVFWSCSREHQSKTRMMDFAKSSLYKQVTVRNHRTVFKLRDLFEEL